MLLGKIVFLQTLDKKIVAGHALAATDDFAVAFRAS
jgi:hypothetical protein